MPPPSAKRQPANRRFAAPLLRAGRHSSAATPASVSEEYDFSYRPDRESGLFRNAAADCGSSEPCGPRFIHHPRGAFRRPRPLLPSERNAQGPAVRHRGGNARARGEMRAATPGQPKNRERSGPLHGGRWRTAGITRQAMPHIRPKQLAPFPPVRRSRCGPKATGTSLSADCALQAFFADWHSASPPRRTKNRERSRRSSPDSRKTERGAGPAWERWRTAGITRQAMPHIRPKQLAPFPPVRRSRCGPKATGTSLSADCALQTFFADWHLAPPPRRTKNRERIGLPQKKRTPVSHPRENGLSARQMFSRPNRKSHNNKPRIRKSKTPRASRKTPADNSSPDIRYGGTFPLRNARPAPIIAPPMRRTASYEAHPTKCVRQSTSGKVHPATVIRRPRRSVRPRPNFAARRPGHRSSMRRTAAAAPAKSAGRSQWTARRFSTTIRPSTTTVSTSAALPQ